MADIIVGLYEDWLWLDERIESLSSEIKKISKTESNCGRLMSVPGIGPMISTATVAAIGTGEAFERGRDLGAWLGLVPRQFSTGGKPILNSERCVSRGNRLAPAVFKHVLIRHLPDDFQETTLGASPTRARVSPFSFLAGHLVMPDLSLPSIACSARDLDVTDANHRCLDQHH
jgi:hypothetical protein